MKAKYCSRFEYHRLDIPRREYIILVVGRKSRTQIKYCEECFNNFRKLIQVNEEWEIVPLNEKGKLLLDEKILKEGLGL